MSLGVVKETNPSTVAYSNDFENGQKFGRYAAFALGAAETAAGVVISATGGTITLTGFGAAVGVPAVGVGATLMGHGGVTTAYALNNLNKVHKVNSSGTGGSVSKNSLPTIDATGKVHGKLPETKDFPKYSKDDLRQLLKELKQSVQKRIEVTTKLGRDRAHGQRQGAEQDLIKSLEKFLGE